MFISAGRQRCYPANCTGASGARFPEVSDAVKEVANCVQYCEDALA
jgi:hypothetical protein